MKTSHVFSVLFVLLLSANFSFSQNCGYYIPLKKGSGIEMQSFNPGGKLSGSYKQMIQDVTAEGDFTVAHIFVENFDAKGNSVGKSNYNIKCNGTSVVIDAKSLLDPQTLSAYKDMEITIEAVDIEIPSSLKVGDVLKDSQVNLKASNQGMEVAGVTMKLTNRTIAAQESVTVPAGTYTCFKMTYDITMEMKTMGFPMTMKMKSIDFYSENVGSVRSEQYDAKGKMLGYNVLSKIF